MNGNSWINDFVERLTNLEGIFEIYVSLFLKYDNQFVFGVKSSRERVAEKSIKKSAISAIGGPVNRDIDKDNIQFLKTRCIQDIGVDVVFEDSPQTYLDYQHRLKKIPVELVKGGIRPHMVTFLQKTGYGKAEKTLIFSYAGKTKNKPQPLQHDALLFAKEHVLVQMFKSEKTVLELKHAGATFDERIKMADNISLFPTGSVNSLLRFLSYEVF